MLEIIPFQYDDIVQKLNDKWTSLGYDPNYAGSNIGVLTSILAYAVSMSNTNSAYISNEKLLTQANNRRNILELGREIGYESEQKISYVYTLTLTASKDSNKDDLDTTTSVYQITRFTQFTDSNNNNWVYVGPNITRNISNYMIVNEDPETIFVIDVKEGSLSTYLTNSLLTITVPPTTDIFGNLVPRNYIEIPLTDVEQTGLYLFIDYIDKNGNIHNQEEWTRNEQYIIEKPNVLNKKFIRLQNFKYGTPRIYFNIGGVGNVIPAGSVCYVNAIISSGASITPGTISSIAGFEYASQVLKITGQDEETNESIKENAPLFYNAANRAVTKYDYISIINRQSNIDSSFAWGGEDEIPYKLGNVWFSTIPYIRPTTFSIVAGYELLKNYWQLNNYDDITKIYNLSTEVDELKLLLEDYKMMTMILNNRYPMYLDSHFTVRVIRYDNTIPKATTHTNIFNVIKLFMQTDIEVFESEYFHSNLIKRIDTDVTDNIGIELLVNNTITIYKQTIFTERDNPDEKQVFLHFNLPFENIFDSVNETIFSDRLPRIDTTGFIEVGDSLYVDYTQPSIPNPYKTTKISYYYPIKYKDIDNVVYNCGRYHIVYGYSNYIKVELYIKDTSSYELMHFNGAIISEFNHEWIINGDANYVGGNDVFVNSLIFNGTTYLTGTSDVFNCIGDKRDFCFELRLRRDDNLKNEVVFGQLNELGITGLQFTNDDYIIFTSNGNILVKSSSKFSDRTYYHHIAVVRNGYNISMYLDGINIGSSIIYDDIIVNNINSWCIGSVDGTNTFIGRLDEFSAVPFAKFTNNFIPPTNPNTLDSFYWQTADWTNSPLTYSMFNSNKTLTIDLANNINVQRPNYKMSRNMFNRFVDVKFIEI